MCGGLRTEEPSPLSPDHEARPVLHSVFFSFLFFFFFARSLISESLTQAMAYEEETPLPVIEMLIRVPFFIF